MERSWLSHCVHDQSCIQLQAKTLHACFHCNWPSPGQHAHGVFRPLGLKPASTSPACACRVLGPPAIQVSSSSNFFLQCAFICTPIAIIISKMHFCARALLDVRHMTIHSPEVRTHQYSTHLTQQLIPTETRTISTPILARIGVSTSVCHATNPEHIRSVYTEQSFVILITLMHKCAREELQADCRCSVCQPWTQLRSNLSSGHGET